MTVRESEPDVSIVVIVYNDAERVGRAVRSVLKQSLHNCEVVVVDDASTDATPEVVGRLVADAPDRVRSLRLSENSGGCGAPRNAGVAVARGRHVMFLDSDDELDRHACANMLSTAERTGVDMVMGRCVRYYLGQGEDGKGVDEDWLPWLFKRQAVYTSLAEEPRLLYDVLSTNKLYRRDFLIREGLAFTEGRFYEDNLFSAHAYLTAKQIAVIPHRVYTWHVQRASGASITTRANQVRNLQDRISISRDIDVLMGRYGTAELKLQKDVRFIEHDLRTHLFGLRALPVEQQQGLIEAATGYVSELAPEAFERARRLHAISAFMVRQRDRLGLLGVLDYHPWGGQRRHLTTDLAERDGRVYWCDSYLDDPLGRRVLDVTDLGLHNRSLGRLDLGSQITDVRACADSVEIAGEVANPLGRMVETGLRGALVFTDRRKGSGRSYTVPVTLQYGTERIRWRADFNPLAVLRPIGLIDPVWDASLRITTAAEVFDLRLFASDDKLSALELPVRPRLTRVFADVLSAYRTESGCLAFRLEARDRVARAMGKAQRAVRSTSLGKAVWNRCRDLERSLRDKLSDRSTKVAVYHRVLTKLPIRRRSVVFESHMGRQFSDSPKYIYEELRRVNRGYRATWVYANRRRGFPADAHLVKRDSWRYYLALARARFWVDNQGFPPTLAKRAGTTYIQTWHGSAFKRMGFDEAELKASTRSQQERMRRALDRFDAFLVRSEHDVKTLVNAFRLRAELVRCGYPRNDALVGGGDPERLAALRETLDIVDGRRVVLYAPTFRPRENGGGARPLVVPFDLSRFTARFGDELVLLVRPHYLAEFALPPALRHAVRDVGHVHDVTELMLLADALITDYSSMMFDYSLLDRPMVFHVPDHEDYVSRSRGSYFDLAEHAPGPLTSDEDELFAALADLPLLGARYAEQRRRFRARFSEYDTGEAARAVVERFFGSGAGRG